MATEVIMPALNPGQETGIFLEWLKQEGDSIEKGEPLMEVETDKANVEVEAPATGILSGISVKPGDEIQVGKVMAMILADGDSAPVSIKEDSSTQSEVSKKVVKDQIEISETLESPENITTKTIAASPKVKQYAKKEGIDLFSIKGSGPGGAIVMEDVLAIKSPKEKEEKDFLTSKGWLLMAERLKHSWTTAPHFSIVRHLNAGKLMAYKNQVQENSAEKMTYTDLLIKLVSVSLKEHPRVNATLIDETIVKNSEINIGGAV
ncbi:uncharacterized protein METZ01_LOCUS367121, partial [marine metagenome]